ncbi:hypothetical protein F5X99DRAFT_23 [Biscogniauxia marginata]|nr:hypothetical protein F5X99DRAFT_23 [Biscogniauxia marginata]
MWISTSVCLHVILFCRSTFFCSGIWKDHTLAECLPAELLISYAVSFFRFVVIILLLTL